MRSSQLLIQRKAEAPHLLAGGAKFLVAGGKTAAIFGEPPKSRIAVVAFENMDKALAAYSSAAYKEALAIGSKYAKFHAYAIEGLPQ